MVKQESVGETQSSLSFFHRLKIIHIISLVAVLGLLVALFFAQWKIRQELKTSADMREVVSVTELSVALSDYVHEQQKERGATAIFLTSNGAKYGPELYTQRALTDEKIEAIRSSAEKIFAENHGQQFESELSELLVKTDVVAEMRSKVDELDVQRPEALKFYTDLNHEVIEFIGHNSRLVDNANIANKLLAYSSFLLGKDSTGIERALGATGFTVGEFDTALKQKLLGHISKQSSLFEFFQRNAPDDMAEALEAELSSPIAEKVNQYREIALSGSSNEVSKVSASEWFDTITLHINALKGMENKISSAITTEAKNEQQHADKIVWQLIVILVAMIAAYLLLTSVLIWITLAGLKSMIHSLEQFAEGRFDVALPAESNTEIGKVSKVLRIFANNAEAQKRDEEQRRLVLNRLGTAISKLSDSNEIATIECDFPEAFEGLRKDFNVAVTALDEARQSRVEAEKAQNQVVDRLAFGLDRLSNGDLKSSIDEEFSPQYENLRSDFNNALARLCSVMVAVVSSISNIRSTSSSITKATDKLASRTESQAATLEEAAAALNEITETVKQTATGSQEACDSVSHARTEADASNEIVSEATHAMEKIKQSSEQISKITGVIEEIASQTNLLALNAGVEAARAGEAGRGFAVVATEVRSLALRSSKAANEIKQSIAVSTQNVTSGVALVEQTGTALQKIAGRVDEAFSLVHQIAGAANEQALALAEVNSAIHSMDKVTQENAAMVAESNSNCQKLSTDTDFLSRQVSHFNTGEKDMPDLQQGDEMFDDFRSPTETTKNIGGPVGEQISRAKAFAASTNGSAALDLSSQQHDDDWMDF